MTRKCITTLIINRIIHRLNRPRQHVLTSRAHIHRHRRQTMAHCPRLERQRHLRQLLYTRQCTSQIIVRLIRLRLRIHATHRLHQQVTIHIFHGRQRHTQRLRHQPHRLMHTATRQYRNPRMLTRLQLLDLCLG